MAEEKKVNLNEKILCPKTGKELSGYKGESSIRPDFGDEACRSFTLIGENPAKIIINHNNNKQ